MVASGFPTSEIPDCQIISKSFERGANYSTTEESVFAMMTPVLVGMRTNASTFVRQMDHLEAVYAPQESDQQVQPGTNIASTPNASLLDPTTGEFVPREPTERVLRYNRTETSGEAIERFYKDCVECEFRLPSLEDALSKLWEGLGEVFERMGKHFLRQLEQLGKLLAFWDQPELDFCQLIEFLKFTCVPDLQKLLSVLMASLMNLAADANTAIDIILSLVSPLITPFLSIVVNLLFQYVLAVVKPLECVLRKLQETIGKFDYSALFQPRQRFDLEIGPQPGEGGGTGHWIKFEDPWGEGKTVAALEYERPSPGWGVQTNIDPMQEIKRSEQQQVDVAEKKLEKIRKEAGDLDTSDPKAIGNHRRRLARARAERDKAKEERDTTEIQQAQKSITAFERGMKSFMWKLFRQIKRAIAVIEGFFQNIVSEFTKLMGSSLGSGETAIQIQFDRLEIIKLLKIIAAIISFIGKGFRCGDPEAGIEDWLGFLPQTVSKHYKITSDEQGNISIKEMPDQLEGALEAATQALGVDPSRKKTEPTPGQSRQKLKSLIELSGDPVVDTEIARLTEVVTTPVETVFKCPLNTSVEQTERINQWMSELDSVK